MALVAGPLKREFFSASLSHDKYLKFQFTTKKLSINKDVKDIIRLTPTPNTIDEYFTPILLGLNLRFPDFFQEQIKNNANIFVLAQTE